jgi:hypothetical protein
LRSAFSCNAGNKSNKALVSQNISLKIHRFQQKEVILNPLEEWSVAKTKIFK